MAAVSRVAAVLMVRRPIGFLAGNLRCRTRRSPVSLPVAPRLMADDPRFCSRQSPLSWPAILSVMVGDPQCHTRRCTVPYQAILSTTPGASQCHGRRRPAIHDFAAFVTANSGSFATPGADIGTVCQVAPRSLRMEERLAFFNPSCAPFEQSPISSAQDHDDRCRTVPTMLSCYAIVKAVIVPSKMQLSQVPPPDRRTLSCAASVRKIHAPQQHRVQAQAVSASATPAENLVTGGGRSAPHPYDVTG